jgi:CheY-like chemotaxis protein
MGRNHPHGASLELRRMNPTTDQNHDLTMSQTRLSRWAAVPLACLFLIGGSLLMTGRALAQEVPDEADIDPFGEIGNGFGAIPEAATATAAKPQNEAEAADDPLVRQLLEHANRGNLQRADAIASLAKLNRWPDVDRLLARTAGANVDEATLTEMFRRIGPTTLLQIKQRSDLSGPAQAGIDLIREAATKNLESADRLSQAIKQLGSSRQDDQLQATRTLLSGGNASIQALVANAITEPPSEQRDNVLRTLVALGPGGLQALRQLALYGNPDARAAALDSLARIDRRGHIVDLIAALHAADATDSERNVATDHLQRLGEIPSRSATVDALANDLRQLHEAAREFDNDGQTTTTWIVDESRSGVSHQSALELHAAYRDVYDAAARLHRLGELPPDLNLAKFAVAMGYHLLVDPDWGDPSQIDEIRQRYPDLMHANALSNVLRLALQSGDHAAAVGLIRLIDPLSITPDDRDELLRGTSGVPSPLVQATTSPEVRVRYEAALKVAELAGASAFAGSSQVRRTLQEMTRLSDHPIVILVETRPEVVISIESLLTGLGLQVDVVQTVGQLQRRIDQGGDVRLLIAKSNLADLSPIEMMDLIRRTDRGRQLPIAMFGERMPYLGEPRWDAPTTWIEGSVTMSSLQELFDLAQRGQRIPPLSILDRQRYRQSATELLNPASRREN